MGEPSDTFPIATCQADWAPAKGDVQLQNEEIGAMLLKHLASAGGSSGEVLILSLQELKELKVLMTHEGEMGQLTTDHYVFANGSYFRPLGSEYNIVYLKKTMKGHATVLQKFDLSKFPLDKHTMELAFEPSKIKTGKPFCVAVNSRGVYPTEISNSTTPDVEYFYTLDPIRVKTLKSFESFECLHSSVLLSKASFPFMAQSCAVVGDFRFDVNIKSDVRPDLYTVRATFYRVSNSFVIQNLMPIIVIILASGLVDGIPSDEVFQPPLSSLTPPSFSSSHIYLPPSFVPFSPPRHTRCPAASPTSSPSSLPCTHTSTRWCRRSTRCR